MMRVNLVTRVIDDWAYVESAGNPEVSPLAGFLSERWRSPKEIQRFIAELARCKAEADVFDYQVEGHFANTDGDRVFISYEFDDNQRVLISAAEFVKALEWLEKVIALDVGELAKTPQSLTVEIEATGPEAEDLYLGEDETPTG
jgi:hypothetical protein